MWVAFFDGEIPRVQHIQNGNIVLGIQESLFPVHGESCNQLAAEVQVRLETRALQAHRRVAAGLVVPIGVQKGPEGAFGLIHLSTGLGQTGFGEGGFLAAVGTAVLDDELAE